MGGERNSKKENTQVKQINFSVIQKLRKARKRSDSKRQCPTCDYIFFKNVFDIYFHVAYIPPTCLFTTNLPIVCTVLYGVIFENVFTANVKFWIKK